MNPKRWSTRLPSIPVHEWLVTYGDKLRPDHTPDGCPHCGTPLLAVIRDRLYAQIGDHQGWHTGRTHNHDYYATVCFRGFRSGNYWIVSLTIIGQALDDDDAPPAGTVYVAAASWSAPGQKDRWRRWDYDLETASEAVAKVRQLLGAVK